MIKTYIFDLWTLPKERCCVNKLRATCTCYVYGALCWNSPVKVATVPIGSCLVLLMLNNMASGANQSSSNFFVLVIWKVLTNHGVEFPTGHCCQCRKLVCLKYCLCTNIFRVVNKPTSHHKSQEILVVSTPPKLNNLKGSMRLTPIKTSFWWAMVVSKILYWENQCFVFSRGCTLFQAWFQMTNSSRWPSWF